jgi:ferritin-like metal-binding protein YciE
MSKIKSLRDLLLHELKDLYSAEKQLLKALPKMAKATSHEELKAAFEEHLEQTEEQVTRLEQVFESLGEKPKAEKCLAMEGLIAEAQKTMGEDMPEAVMDAALIAAAQRVEHYEIAGYGTVRTFAEILEEDEAAGLLEQTLEEEKETDERLTEIAESLVNPDAESEDEEE